VKYYVYILTNRKEGVLYIGFTKDLKKKILEHKNKRYKKSFSAKYKTDELIYFEEYKYVLDASKREKKYEKVEERMEN